MKNLFLLATLLASTTFAQTVPPEKDFITLHGGSFELIVDAKHQAEGEFYFHKLMQADAFNRNYFQSIPEKTIVIINDRTDLTNGYATKIPYSHIMVFPVLPGPLESIGEPGDWTLELLTHEYAHILTFEPANGAFHYLRPIFGTIMSPNLLLPTWWKEGLAVQMESMVSTGGRLRSTYQEAMIRSWVLDQTFYDFNIAQANENLPTWPQGQRPYLFGSLFWSQTTSDKGPTVIKDLNERHGGRMPYFIEAAAEDHIGRRYEPQYERALSETQRRAEIQIQELKKTPPTVDQNVEIPKSVLAQMPSFSADGKYMSLITRNSIAQRRLRVFERNSDTQNFVQPKELPLDIVQDEDVVDKKIFDGPPGGTMNRSYWFHNKPILVFDRVDDVSATDSYSDLYLLDIEQKKTKRLTRGLRGREAAVSTDDSQLVYVQLGMATTSLATMNLTTMQTEVLLTKPLQHRIAFPVFLDANRILYSVSTPDGKENLEIFYLDSKKTETPPHMPAGRNRIPELTKDGFIFISTANGVNNVYFSSFDFKKVFPITHTLTGYFSAQEDPNTHDIYATKMSGSGPQLVRIEKTEWQKTPTTIPKIPPMFEDRYPAREKPAEDQTAVTAEPYSPWGYLWPHYWIPFFNFTENGWAAEAITSGYDPLQRHSYSLALGWENDVQRLSWNASYLNTSYSWPYFVQSLKANTYLVDKNSYQTVTAWLLGSQKKLFSIHKDLTVGAGVQGQNIEVPGNTLDRRGVFVLGTFGELTQAGMQISPESDRSYYLKVDHYPSNNQFPVHTQSWLSTNIYLSKYLPDRHSFMWKFSGLYTQEKISGRYGTSSIAFSTTGDTVLPQFLMRGYLQGHFYGKTAVNQQIEYRFPLREMNRGAGTDPLFLRRVHGALVHDGMMVDGYAYRRTTNSYMRDEFGGYYSNLGAELRLDTVVGYVLPVRFILGHYVPLDLAVGGNSATAFSIQINQFF